MRVLVSLFILGFFSISSAKTQKAQVYHPPKPKKFTLLYGCSLHILDSANSSQEQPPNTQTLRKNISIPMTGTEYEVFQDGDIKISVSLPITTTHYDGEPLETSTQAQISIVNTTTKFSVRSIATIGQPLSLVLDDVTKKKLFVADCYIR